MIRTLHIYNYAIIDEIHIDFSPHLNVITGETGAGKSILMGALSLILGDRADTSLLLDRNRKCIVEGVFEGVVSRRLYDLLHEHDLDEGLPVPGDPDGSRNAAVADAAGRKKEKPSSGSVQSSRQEAPAVTYPSATAELVIRREIGVNGKSRAFINDTPVNLELLRRVSSQLVDLHRQFDTLSLSDSDFQLEVLDSLAGSSSLLQKYQTVFFNWSNARRELEQLLSRKSAFEKEYDYHRFLYEELEELGLAENELEEAEAELKLQTHAESIKTALLHASDMLSGAEAPLVQQLRSLHHQLAAFAPYHAGLDALLQRLQAAQLELQDVADELERANDKVVYDPEQINRLNERMAAGYRLLKKHGVRTTAELLGIGRELEGKLQASIQIDEAIAGGEKETKALLAQLEALAEELSALRRKQVKPLQEKVNHLLVQVGMPNARLKVRVEKIVPGPDGGDRVEFLFDANMPAGKEDSSRYEPLRKVASGGELSRLMLCVKSLVAESMNLPTLIFDEIDTGISGEAAKQVGVIMNRLAAARQVITITHQPQIAGRAHTHFWVYKDLRDDGIRTGIRVLNHDERVEAIARMLGGERPTAAALQNAREMLGA